MTAQEKFYTNLSVAMTQKGLSAIDLSKALAVPPATVYRWLRNEGKVGGVMPQPRTLKAIAESLGVNSEWLAGNDEHMHTAPDPLDTGSKHIQSHAMKILATLLRSNDDKIHKEAVAYMMEILSNHLE